MTRDEALTKADQIFTNQFGRFSGKTTIEAIAEALLAAHAAGVQAGMERAELIVQGEAVKYLPFRAGTYHDVDSAARAISAAAKEAKS